MPAKPAIERPQRPSWQGWMLAGIMLLVLCTLCAIPVAMVADFLAALELAGTGQQPEISWTSIALCVLGAVILLTFAVMYVLEAAQKPVDYQYIKARIDAGHTFFLYLRPFVIERRLLLGWPVGGIPYLWALPPVRMLFGLEGKLKSAMEKVGSVMVGIGEKDKSPGIAKLTPTDAEWQKLFIGLATRSCGIFVVPFTSAGSLWEFDWIVDNALDKTILILPPVYADPVLSLIQSHGLPQQWQTLRQRYGDRLELPPEYPAEGMLLTLQRLTDAPDARWKSDVSFPLKSSELDKAVDHILWAGRLGGLVEL